MLFNSSIAQIHLFEKSLFACGHGTEAFRSYFHNGTKFKIPSDT